MADIICPYRVKARGRGIGIEKHAAQFGGAAARLKGGRCASHYSGGDDADILCRSRVSDGETGLPALQKVTARPLALGTGPLADPEVIRMEFEPDDLIVTVRSLSSALEYSLRFGAVIGFRVLDEHDLLEFWPACSTMNGPWAFEVTSGGWLAGEFKRSGSLMGHMSPEAREFFVAGCNSCVSVIGWDEPVLWQAK